MFWCEKMIDKSWLNHVEATWFYQHLRHRMNQGLIQFFQRTVFDEDRTYRVAEVACGSGYGAHLLAAHPRVELSVAADISLEDFLEAGIRDYQAAFVLMDIFSPALQPATMDLVWNSSSLEELDQPDVALAAMVRLTRPGGRVFVGVPNKRGPAGWLRTVSGSRTRAWLGRVYGRSKLRNLFSIAGLEVEAETVYLGGTFIGVLGKKSLVRDDRSPHQSPA